MNFSVYYTDLLLFLALYKKYIYILTEREYINAQLRRLVVSYPEKGFGEQNKSDVPVFGPRCRIVQQSGKVGKARIIQESQKVQSYQYQLLGSIPSIISAHISCSYNQMTAIPNELYSSLEGKGEQVQHSFQNSHGPQNASRENSLAVILPSNMKDVKDSLGLNEDQFLTLESRICGVPKNMISEMMGANSSKSIQDRKSNPSPVNQDSSSRMLGDISSGENNTHSNISLISGTENTEGPSFSFGGGMGSSSRRKSGLPKKRDKIKYKTHIKFGMGEGKRRKLEQQTPTSNKHDSNHRPLSNTTGQKGRREGLLERNSLLLGEEKSPSTSTLDFYLKRQKKEEECSKYMEEGPGTMGNILPSQNLNMLFTQEERKELLRSKQENETLRGDLCTAKSLQRTAEQDLERERREYLALEEKLKAVVTLAASLEENKAKGREAMIHYLGLLQTQKKNSDRLSIQSDCCRLGKSTYQRSGMRIIDKFEEGEDFRKLREKQHILQQEREEIERLRKLLKQQQNSSKKKSVNVANMGPPDHPNNNSDVEEQEEKVDLEEQRELLTFRLNLINKEESRLKEQLEQLDIEKCIFIAEFKRVFEEQNCKFLNEGIKKPVIIANRYLVLSLLGKGGYSEVYKAYDLESHIEVACKIHQLDPHWAEGLKENYIKHAIRENEIHQGLNHPRVVRQFATIEVDRNSFCTVLELCQGPDLYMYLKRYKMLPEKEAKMVILQILSGLKYLNQQKVKIIHYDLKPQNILFHKGEVKISDFGLCKAMETNTDKIELTSQGVGTYWYLSPECFELGKPMISPKVDVWSLGVIFYELLYGQKPFGHNMTQEKILKENTIRNAHQVIFPNKPIVSAECKEFLKKCLAYEQHERYDVLDAYYSNYFRGKK